jgi:hypothetical protein
VQRSQVDWQAPVSGLQRAHGPQSFGRQVPSIVHSSQTSQWEMQVRVAALQVEQRSHGEAHWKAPPSTEMQMLHGSQVSTQRATSPSVRHSWHSRQVDRHAPSGPHSSHGPQVETQVPSAVQVRHLPASHFGAQEPSTQVPQTSQSETQLP